MIILQYGGIFVRDGLFMAMIIKGKAPEGYEAFEGDDGAYKIKVYA